MSQHENDRPGDGALARRNEVAAKEAEVLAKAKDVAKRIVDRVNKALNDTGTHTSLPTEEKKPLE